MDAVAAESPFPHFGPMKVLLERVDFAQKYYEVLLCRVLSDAGVPFPALGWQYPFVHFSARVVSLAPRPQPIITFIDSGKNQGMECKFSASSRAG